jgi:hypothetical protein
MNTCSNSPQTRIFIPSQNNSVTKYTVATFQEGRVLRQIFRNHDEPLFSLINRIEIWKDQCGVEFINLFLTPKGCEQFKNRGTTHMKADFFHHHEFNCCKIQVTNRNDLYALLSILNENRLSYAKL